MPGMSSSYGHVELDLYQLLLSIIERDPLCFASLGSKYQVIAIRYIELSQLATNQGSLINIRVDYIVSQPLYVLIKLFCRAVQQYTLVSYIFSIIKVFLLNNALYLTPTCHSA